MTSYIVTEGPTDALVLRALLDTAGRDDIHIVEAGGKSSAVSLGTSLALESDNRVAIVVDADTTDSDRIAEQQIIFQDLQSDTSRDETCRLFLAVPTLEEDLFRSVETFSSVFNLSHTEPLGASDRERWGRALKQLSPRSHERRPQHGNIPQVQADAAKIIDHRLIKDLISFLPAPKVSYAS